MPVQDTNVVDLVVHDSKTDSVVLCMVEVREWQGGLLSDLRAKFGTYLTYALDGQLLQDYPGMAGKPIRIELKTDFPPPQREQEYLDRVTRDYLAPQGISFAWSILKKGPNVKVRANLSWQPTPGGRQLCFPLRLVRRGCTLR